ncbi:unnamed protein product [Rotaria socialis]|uniref:Uncharacterized protein n=1 Tax=Rotaria socialis TaxID=392032 RepID=A0A821K3R6_9BILA|nr:unnamed protein product [Rotaria socialis]CAF4468169.1 unnamed protein product [Rotaria socialis]CAF4731701.1 unnamed protein product [Rotaria socialis]
MTLNSSETKTILIVGGGLGGSALAQLLQQELSSSIQSDLKMGCIGSYMKTGKNQQIRSDSEIRNPIVSYSRIRYAKKNLDNFLNSSVGSVNSSETQSPTGFPRLDTLDDDQLSLHGIIDRQNSDAGITLEAATAQVDHSGHRIPLDTPGNMQ